MKNLIQAPSIDTNDIRRKGDGDTHNEGSSCRHRNPRINVHTALSDSQILSWDDATGSRCHCEQIIPAQRAGHQTQWSRGAKSQFTGPREPVEQVSKANYSPVQEVGHSASWVTCFPQQASRTRKTVLRQTAVLDLKTLRGRTTTCRPWHFKDLASKKPGILQLLSHYLETRPMLRPWQLQQISGLAQVLLEFSVDSTLSHPSGKGQGLATEINKDLCFAQLRKRSL